MDMTLIAQTISLVFPALWLTLGVRDNIIHPALNETFTAQVFAMERMKDDYPDDYARVQHRAVSNRTVQKIAFRLVVLGELSTVIVLWSAVALMVLSLVASVPVSTAKAVATLGALMFTSIWAMFLIVGENFSYWYCHEGAQNTHFQMTLWGMANLIFLSL
ncbi:DUF2165 domain-containing protein [uncultured Shimia sp.]|uniref:DUF2165 domain-containing protein n=1 Tax=uncultured Shimia sp. TaxID=573152 RepID=UPI002623619F|nr:DUF2165 domain-containing protein [uncultured Shimia sp.]